MVLLMNSIFCLIHTVLPTALVIFEFSNLSLFNKLVSFSFHSLIIIIIK